MTHWTLQCRCSPPVDLPPRAWPGWCGNPATAEDGLCRECRETCLVKGGTVLTMEQVRERDRRERGAAHG